MPPTLEGRLAAEVGTNADALVGRRMVAHGGGLAHAKLARVVDKVRQALLRLDSRSSCRCAAAPFRVWSLFLCFFEYEYEG